MDADFGTFEVYRETVAAAMLEYGATDEDLALITDEVIWNGIRDEGRNPRDVAWALLQ